MSYRITDKQTAYLQVLLREAFSNLYRLPYRVELNTLNQMPRAEASELIQHLVDAKARGWKPLVTETPKYGYVFVSGVRQRAATLDELTRSLAALRTSGKKGRAAGKIYTDHGEYIGYVADETSEGRTEAEVRIQG